MQVLLAGICMWMMHVSSVSSENVLVAVSHKAEIENNQGMDWLKHEGRQSFMDNSKIFSSPEPKAQR